MTHILLVSQEKSVFTDLVAAFSDNSLTTEWADSAENALSMVSQKKIDMVIIDEKLPDMTGRALVEKIIFKNAMINCVVLSQLSHDEFHEVFEGLGVLMQFPPVPGREHAQTLLEHLNHIDRIGSRASSPKGETS